MDSKHASTCTAEQSPALPPREGPLLSVVIKTLNEEAMIADCIRSALAATRHLDSEVIVADSASTDRTAAIAGDFPVTFVRITNRRDRSCGAGAQLGYQFARGRYLLLMDGDMVLQKSFLPQAIAVLQAEPDIAGVGGNLVEQSTTLEFTQRLTRLDPTRGQGTVPYLNGLALYRMNALRTVGYFTNRNLHCREEFELGLRLRSKGWRMVRIGVHSADHHGDSISSWTLLARRWRSRYLCGYGELIRSALGMPFFWEVIRSSLLFLSLIGWWILIGVLAGSYFATTRIELLVAAGCTLVLPLLALAVRKRSPHTTLYSFVLWNLCSAALLRGLFSTQLDPTQSIESEVVRHEQPEIASGLSHS